MPDANDLITAVGDLVVTLAGGQRSDADERTVAAEAFAKTEEGERLRRLAMAARGEVGANEERREECGDGCEG